MFSILRPERERHRREQARERRRVVPPEFFVQIKNRKNHEDRERDNFLDDLQLRGGIDRVAPAVRGNHQDVFKKRDAPARKDDERQRLALEFQMAIPRERHEDIRDGQQHNRQPAGF